MTNPSDRFLGDRAPRARALPRSARFARALCIGAFASVAACAPKATDADAAPDVSAASDVTVTATDAPPVDAAALDAPVADVTCACCWNSLIGEDCYVVMCAPGYTESYDRDTGLTCSGPDMGPATRMEMLTRPTGGWCSAEVRTSFCPESGPLEPPELPV